MSYIERTDAEIIQAWERAVERSLYPNSRRLLFPDGDGTRYISPAEFIEEMHQGDEDLIVFFVDGYRDGSRMNDTDPVAVIDAMDIDSELLEHDAGENPHDDSDDLHEKGGQG